MQLSLEQVGKTVGPSVHLHPMSLNPAPDAVTVLLGATQAGKTSLMRLMAGLDVPTSGRVLVDGRDVTGTPVRERNVAMVYQQFINYPSMTVFDNIASPLKLGGRPRAEIERRVRELAARLHIEVFLDRLPAELSGGQQQRVALARALAIEPGLLLLDEPLSALDARVRVHLRHEIKALHRRLGVTTIMVTHDQEEALTMADRIVVMNHGVIDQIGTPEEIYRAPATPFVADFVGTMNLLDGVVLAPGRVRVGDAELLCDAAAKLAAGTLVGLCIRPEDIRVRDIGPDAPNRLAAAIEDIDFLGSFCRATLVLAAVPGAELTGDFSINLMRDYALKPGQPLAIALPPDRLRVFAKAE